MNKFLGTRPTNLILSFLVSEFEQRILIKETFLCVCGRGGGVWMEGASGSLGGKYEYENHDIFIHDILSRRHVPNRIVS